MQYVPKGMSPSVDRLCRHTLQTIHHNHILSKEVLSYSIYAYLTNYRPTRMNQIKCDQSIYDGAILHEDGATHSVYLMHIAWTVSFKSFFTVTSPLSCRLQNCKKSPHY